MSGANNNVPQGFRPGWRWMTNPTRNNGEPMPVLLTKDEGGEWYEPLEPEGSVGQFEWGARHPSWRTVAASEAMGPEHGDWADKASKAISLAEALNYRWTGIGWLRSNADAPAAPDPSRLSDADIDALMPESDGMAEVNVQRVEVLPGMMGTEFEEAPAWSAEKVRATVRAALALQGAQAS